MVDLMRCSVQWAMLLLSLTALASSVFFETVRAERLPSNRSLASFSDRNLAPGDFAELNEIINEAVFMLPDTTVADGLLLKVNSKDLECTHFSLDDLILTHASRTSTSVSIQVQLTGLDMFCSLRYDYSGLVFFGSGSATMDSLDNSVDATVRLLSDNYDLHPPTEAMLQDCEAIVSLDQVNFEGGGLLGVLPEAVKNLVINLVEDRASDFLCNKMGELTTTDLKEWLQEADAFLQGFPEDPDVDPLRLEKDLFIPGALQLLNLQDKETPTGEWVNWALEEAVVYLSEIVEDTELLGGTTLRINRLLRNFLGSDGAFLLNVDDVVPGGVLYQHEDQLTFTKATLNSIKLFGLDTFIKFNPLDTIGKYTLQNELAWEFLSMQINLTLDIRPSTAPDSVISSPSDTRVIEEVTVNVGFKELNTTASFLLGIRQETMETIELGALLWTENIIPCVLSALFDFRIAGLEVNVADVLPPILDGFVSPGIDRVVTGAVDAAAVLYENPVLKAAPAIFDSTVREAINSVMVEAVGQARLDGDCPDLRISGNNPIDLRDLLLKPDEAEAAGGSGTEPYGDLFSSTIVPELTERFLTNDENGSPKLNAYIRDLTEAQSGIGGSVIATGDILDSTTSFEEGILEFLLSQLRIQLFDAGVRNLDTLIPPLSVVVPTREDTIENELHFGPVPNRPIILETHGLFLISGEGSPIEMRNEVRFRWLVPSSVANIDYFATVGERSLLELPLKDLSNVHCWLASFVESGAGPGLAVSGFLVAMSNATLELECMSCSSPGGQLLSEVVGTLEEIGLYDFLRERAGLHAVELFWSIYDSLGVDRLLSEAPLLCPSSQEYSQGSKSSFRWPSFPHLSKPMLETGAVLLTTIMNSLFVLTMKSHSIQEERLVRDLQTPQGNASLDWTRLGETVGEWADSALREAQQYLNSPNEADENVFVPTREIGLNKLIRGLLDEDGFYVYESQMLVVDALGFKVRLHQVKVSGLDSASKARVLMPSSPQTLKNSVVWDDLSFVFDFFVDYVDESAIPVSEIMSVEFHLKEVDVNFELLTLVDLSLMGEIQIQSIFNTTDILPCLLSKMRNLAATELRVGVGEIKEPTITGFLVPQVNDKFTSFSTELYSRFKEDVLSGFTSFSSTTLRDSLNAVLKGMRENSDKTCATFNASPTGYIDFRELLLSETDSVAFGGSGKSTYGDTFRRVFEIASKSLQKLDNSNRLSLNDDVILPWTASLSNESGSLIYLDDVLNTNATIDLSTFAASANIRLSDARIDNMDSFGLPLSFLAPIQGEAQTLNNTLTLGTGNPLRLAARLTVTVAGDADLQLRNEIDIKLDVSMLTVFLSVFLPVSENMFTSFPLGEVTNLDCWLSMISPEAIESPPNQTSLLRYGVAAEGLDLNVTCVSCTSPEFDKLVQQLYSPQDSDGEVADFVSQTVAYVDTLVGSDFVGNFVDQAVQDASKQCPVHPNFDPNATRGDFLTRPETYFGFDPAERDQRMVFFNVANLCFAAFLCLLFIATKLWVRRSNTVWKTSLNAEKLAAVDRAEEEEQDKVRFMNLATPAMYKSPDIPPRIRYLAPLAILFNIGLYLGGHLGLLSSIHLHATVAGESFSIYRVLDFSFFAAVMRTYNNGGNEMAVLVIIFSGIFPYIKLVGSLFLWLAPPRWVSVPLRGTVFLWLDVLTKLSIVDIFMTALAVAAVLVFIGGPDEDLKGTGELYSLRLEVVPFGAFYCILIAQRFNRTSSRFFYEYHEKIVEKALEQYATLRLMSQNNNTADESEECEEGCLVASDHTLATQKISQTFSSSFISEPGDVSLTFDDEAMETAPAANAHPLSLRPSFVFLGREARSKWTRGGAAVGFAIIAALILAIIGMSFAPSVSMEANRVLGIALETDRTFEQAVQDYNVFQVICMVLVQARFVLDSTSDYVGLGILLFLVIFVSAVFPAMQAYSAFKRWREARRNKGSQTVNGDTDEEEENDEGDSDVDETMSAMTDEGGDKTFVNEMKLLRNVEVYIIAFVVANWQLGAMTAYAVHTYCVNLDKIYHTLAFIGLVEDTTSECFRVQASDVRTISILLGSFLILGFTFVRNVWSHRKKNQQALEVGAKVAESKALF